MNENYGYCGSKTTLYLAIHISAVYKLSAVKNNVKHRKGGENNLVSKEKLKIALACLPHFSPYYMRHILRKKSSSVVYKGICSLRQLHCNELL